MIYTGIGSRQTPDIVINFMTDIGRFFGQHKIMLRSGGAPGADSAFEAGADYAGGPKQIFLPSSSFNGRQAYGPNMFYMDGPEVNSKLAYELAERVWNNRLNMLCDWNRLKMYTKKMMARNTLQILGPSLDVPTDLIICWTKDGEASGGTGQALAMANQINMNKKLDYVIPTINLQKESHRIAISNVLGGSDPVKFIETIKGFLLKECGKTKGE